jgi:hypothetical protein
MGKAEGDVKLLNNLEDREGQEGMIEYLNKGKVPI